MAAVDVDQDVVEPDPAGDVRKLPNVVAVLNPDLDENVKTFWVGNSMVCIWTRPPANSGTTRSLR